MKKVDIKDFKTLDFPENIKAIYVIFFVRDNKEIPFYVGETGRFLGRISDYISANFKASTDFKIGEAIKYFQEKGLKVIIKYKPAKDRKQEQSEIIKDFQSFGYRLLNELVGYDYKIADESEERERIKKFCDNILIKI